MRQPAISVKSLSNAMVLALAVISFCLLWVMEYARKHAQDE
jgi:hypothetical protein